MKPVLSSVHVRPHPYPISPTRPPCHDLYTGKVSYEPDSAVEAIVKAMPSAVKASNRTANLGLLESAGAHEIVEEYVKGERLR